MKIEIEIPDDFKTKDMAERQEQMLDLLKQFGSLMHEHGQVASGEYINVLLIACGLFTGYCVKDAKDCEVVKAKIVCPRILLEMISTLGEYTTEGIKQKQRKVALAGAVPEGRG